MTRSALTFAILGVSWVIAPSRSDAQTARTTANQGLAAHYGWQDPDGSANGVNALSFPLATGDSTLVPTVRIYNTVGDPTSGANLPAYNGNYTLTFKLTATTPTLGSGQNSTITSYLTTEYSTDSAASWTSVGGTSQVTASRSTPGVTTTTQAFTVTLNFTGGGPDWIRLILRGTSSGNASGGQVKVQVYASTGWGTDPYAVTWSNIYVPGKPVVDATPYNSNDQDYSRCAQACFAATYAQSTVPYFSLDAPRQAVLVYNGDRVNPRPFVNVNVSPDLYYGSWPTKYQLQVKINGVNVTFVNTEQTLNFAYTGTAPVRIGGQFDASSYTAMRLYSMDILVTAVYTGTSVTNDYVTKFMVVNWTADSVARGWGIGGVQHLYTSQIANDSSVFIVEGDGSAVYFAKSTGPFVSPPGDFSTLVLSNLSGTSGWARLYPDSTKVVFNSTGLMTRVLDRFGNRDSVVYDVKNRVSKLIDPLNLAITLTYDGNGLTSIQDPMGRVTDIVVDGSKRLTTITDPDNVSTTFGYDASLRLSTIRDRRGNADTLRYDAQSGTLASVTPAAVEVVNSDGTIATASPVTSFEPWQKKGVPYGLTGTTSLTPPAADTVYARITDPGGHTTRFTVNRWGMPAVVTDPLGRTDSTRFNPNGLPTRVRSAVGTVDSAMYNTSGLPTYAKASGLPATRYRYVGWAQADSAWTEDGVNGARYFVGANGRMDSVRLAGGTPDVGVTRVTYETRGRVATVTDPLQHSVQSTQYAGTNGNRSQDVLPGSRVTTYGYDSYGRQTTVSRPSLATTTTYYSIINRPDSVRDGVDTLTTRYGYDNLFLTSVTDPKGQAYGFTYNAVGWLTQRTDPVHHSDVYKYDRDGELRLWTNRRSQTITYIYDAGHRETGKSGTNTATETWSYPSDTVVVATSPVATDTTVANRHGQLLYVTTRLAGQNYKRRYTYTTAGALDSVVPTGAGLAFQIRQYVWNLKRGALTSIKLGTNTAVGHDADGLTASLTLPGGDVLSSNYSTLHATANISTTAGYSASVNRSLGQDSAGRVYRQILNTTQGRQYRYDRLGRLAGDSDLQSNGVPCDPHTPPNDNGAPCTFDPAWAVSGAGFNYRFSYDQAGNRTDLGGTYDTANRITNFNGCSYGTDLDGNVTSGCGRTFTWTAEGRLASITASGQTTAFDYNAAGQLVKKTAAGVTHYFLWEGDNLLAELDGAGTTMIAEYSYYPGLDNLHALKVGPTKYFAHADGVGNVIALTDTAQQLSRTYRYWAWGENTGGGVDYANLNGKDRARFKGALWFGDAGGTDLYYMRNRWYDPGTGRFLSEDPKGLAAGINPYVFAMDDPVNRRDPTGLDVSCDGIVVIVDGEERPCSEELLGGLDAWLWENYGFGLRDALNGTSGECSFGGRRVIACQAGSSFRGGGLGDETGGVSVTFKFNSFFKGCKPSITGTELPGSVRVTVDGIPIEEPQQTFAFASVVVPSSLGWFFRRFFFVNSQPYIGVAVLQQKGPPWKILFQGPVAGAATNCRTGSGLLTGQVSGTVP